MDPADFMDDFTKEFEECLPYMLMPFRTLCPHCYGRLTNPIPVEESGYVRVCYLKTKKITMECMECGRHTTICRSLPLDDDKFSYEEPRIPLYTLNDLDGLEDPHKDREETDQYLAMQLLLEGLDRQAAEVAGRLADASDDPEIAAYASVLAACGIMEPDDLIKELKNIQSEENVYFEATCILCALNEAWHLGDGRFNPDVLEELLTDPHDDVERQVKRSLPVSSGRAERPRKPHPWRTDRSWIRTTAQGGGLSTSTADRPEPPASPSTCP